MPLGLHEAPHDGEARGKVSRGGVHEERRKDGVVRPLPPSDDVAVAGNQREVRAAVLQREAAAAGDQPGPETHVVGVYHRHGVPSGVHHLRK